MTVLVSIQQPVRAWQIPPECVATLRQRHPDLSFLHATDDHVRATGLRECDVAFTWILSSPELAAAPRLRWVHTSAVAVETLCLPELFARGILVSNSRGVQSTPIAEHVFAVMLGLAKQLPFVLERQVAHTWSQNDFYGARLPWLLQGRTLGLIGFGTIGSEIARLATAFGMNVVVVRRSEGRLTDVLEQSDVLVIAAPLTPATQQMIGRAELARMKPGSLLINVGRARIIDHLALVDALHSGHLGGASLDVFHAEPLPPDDPLWSAPNVILTPHTSGFRRGHWDDVIDVFSDNLRRFQRDEPLRFRVEPALGY
jgi:phosphoglycerate dehydrogenase-like enzyme